MFFIFVLFIDHLFEKYYIFLFVEIITTIFHFHILQNMELGFQQFIFNYSHILTTLHNFSTMFLIFCFFPSFSSFLNPTYFVFNPYFLPFRLFVSQFSACFLFFVTILFPFCSMSAADANHASANTKNLSLNFRSASPIFFAFFLCFFICFSCFSFFVLISLTFVFQLLICGLNVASSLIGHSRKSSCKRTG